jgi:hypothetical protein
MEKGAPMIFLIGLVLLAAIFSGWVIFRRQRELEPIDRAIATAMPVMAALLMIEIVLNILTEPFFGMNDVRLTRTLALFNGIKLYPGANATGPIIGTLHTPVSHILFWPAIFAATPASAICIASAIAFVLVLGPLLWLHWPRTRTHPRNVLFSFYALITCGCILFRDDTSGGMRASVFHVHTDAAAICFAAMAGAVICLAKFKPGWGHLLLSSAFAVLSLGSKQTMAPALLALCIFLLMADGLRTALRYAICLLGSGLVLCAALACWFRPAQDVLFNIVTLASHRPYKNPLITAFRELFSDATMQGLTVVFCLLFFVLYWYFYERNPGNGWRRLFSVERWIIFPLIGVFLVPVCVKAQLTVGADLNHIGMACFFLTLGTTLGLSRFMKDETSVARAAVAKLLAAVLILVSLPGVIGTVFDSAFKNARKQPDVTVTYEYAMKHPGRAYFPRNPLAEFYAQHRFYHYDGALIDRELAGHEIGQAQLVSGIPSDAALIAIEKDQHISKALLDYMAGWPQINDPELPGWIVYQRPSAGSY